MMRLSRIFGALAFLLIASHPIEARAQSPSGEELLKKYWAATKAGDMSEEAKWYAKGFQSAHEDGGRDRAQELELLKNVNLGDYTLSGIKITEQGPVIVATYFIDVAETLVGQRLPERKAARLTVFLKTDEGWKVIAHANLNPLKK